MNALNAALRDAATNLDRHGRPWALVGGFAVSARADPRFTRDIDVAVMVDDDGSAESLVHALRIEGYTAFTSIEHDNGRLATVRLKRAYADAEITTDLLFASSGIEHDITKAADRLEVVPGLVLPVAATGHLIALKLLARNDETRPQDLADLRALRSIATPSDLALAREAVGLIAKRGYGRGRDLEAALDDLETLRR